MLSKATTTSLKDWSVAARDHTRRPPPHETDTLTTRPPWRLQIIGDVIYWIIMVVSKPFNPFPNDKF